MSIVHTYNHTIKDDAGKAVIADVLVLSADTERNLSVQCPTGLVTEVDMGVTVAQIVSFFVESDQAITMKLNSTGSPASPSPVALVAKRAYWWHNQLTSSNPLTVDITKFYFDNTTGAKVANVVGGFLLQE
jgi:hypothetical protein